VDIRKKVAIGLVALRPLSPAACSDEDNDGPVTAEEVNQVDEGLEEGANELAELGDEETEDPAN
jgi:hypothetical protein